MNKKTIYKGGKLVVAAMTGAVCMTACSEEPDGSNLYDADGLTIEQIIMQRSDLTGFNAILKKCDYDKRIATYKEYTVFAPQNESVSLYPTARMLTKEHVSSITVYATLLQRRCSRLSTLTLR